MRRGTGQFGYKVTFDTRCNEETIQHGEGAYNYSWSCDCTNYLGEVSKSKEFPDVVSEHDLKIGEVAYLVWAEWSNGDSFGNGNRNNVEAFGLFKDRESAEKFVGELQSKNKGDYSVPWNGYFESLDDLHVTGVIIF